MGHAQVILAVAILENSLITVEPMVIGRQLLMSPCLATLVDLRIKTVSQSHGVSGTEPVTSQRLKISINKENLGSFLTR